VTNRWQCTAIATKNRRKKIQLREIKFARVPPLTSPVWQLKQLQPIGCWNHWSPPSNNTNLYEQTANQK
jgi:hypothetical protein